MFSKKFDVDRHVEKCLKKINSETERNLRCFSFAKLYFGVGEYEQARRYVSTYLSVKPNSAEAHNFLGKTLEKLGRKEAALDAYRTSLQLDPNQNNLILKVCEILAQGDLNVEQSRVKYFYEMAQQIDPHNPVVYTLREKLITSEKGDPTDLTTHYLKELETRPTDVNLRIRLLRHLLQHNSIKEAFKHAADTEQLSLSIFYNNLNWYEVVAEILLKYQQNSALSTSLDWQFWFLSVSILEKLAALCLDEHTDNIKTSAEYVASVYNFDQTLQKASQNINDCPDRQLAKEFLNHYGAQLHFHLSTLMLKQAKNELLKYKDAINCILPLLFASYHTPPPDLQALWLSHLPENRRPLLAKWHKEASFRCSQVGHILQAAAKDRKSTIIEKANQYSTGMWKELLFKRLFITRDQQMKMSTSYFVTNSADVVIRLPEKDELLKHDQAGQFVHPDSLHHHIWLALNTNLPEYQISVFDGLPYSMKNLKNCGAETLNILDLHSFVYSAALSAQNMEDYKTVPYYHTEKPPLLPASITHNMGTVTQSKFFSAAWKMYKNKCGNNIGELRLILIKGIEVVRCLDQHGYDVKLLILLAQTFGERAKLLTKQSEIEFNEARAELYWKAALPLLEKLYNNQAVIYPVQRYFNYKSKEMSIMEVGDNIEKGKLFIATQLMKKKEYEKALRYFELLKDPYASFYQAMIYKTLADQQVNQNKENVTSEMRSKHIILLSRARDCLYLTLDRLREPAVDQKHPLNAQIFTEIDIIERLLSRIDPDCSNRNECDGMSDENVSSNGSDHYVTGFTTGISPFNRTDNLHSTPYKYDVSRREAKPSPERLDAQIRQLTASRDATMSYALEQGKVIMESQKTIADELKEMKQGFNDFKKSIDDLKQSRQDEIDNVKNVTDLVYELRKELDELKKDVKTQTQLSDEDIYGLANDYNDYNINTINTNLYNPGLQARLPAGLGGNSLYPLYPGMYPMYPYGGLAGLPSGLPQFDQQLNPLQYAQTPLFNNTTATPNLTQLGQQFNKPATIPPQIAPSIAMPSIVPSTTIATRAPPVNVVITSSDPLPKTPTSQPILSVTIPAQHLKGNKAHNYQIPLTTTASITSTPSVLTKPPPIITTQSLLSNVAPPVYSAITTESASQKNLSLGLQIEKTLDQTFNNSNMSNTSNNSTGEEHDPCSDFKPIVPLPDEVSVTTGEENEKVLFSGRAKLFRYVTKEWRERGIGVLKILQNPESGKVRIIMRRDQVHKICANHLLTKDMTLRSKNDRAYIWAAQDYADGEVVSETFCAMFKTADDAAKFFKAFEDAKGKVVESPKKERVVEVAKNSQQENKENINLGGFTFSSQPTFKPTIVEAKTPVVAATTKTTTSPFAGFTFTVPKPEVKEQVTKSTLEEPAEDHQDDFVPSADFKPLVPLPELVEVKTGEEDAEVLFESTAKLLRFDNSGEIKEWKERGTGTMKLLKETDSIRLLMRRDQIHKICCNHRLLKNTEFKIMANNPKAITWCAKDFSEGVLKPETLCIKFRSKELAESFLQAIKDAQNLLDLNNSFSSAKGESSTASNEKIGFGDKFKPVKGMWECKTCYIYNDAKTNTCVACDTPKTGASVAKTDPTFSFGGLNTWGDAFKPKEGSWACQTCLVRNEADKMYCVSCETPKDDKVPKKTETKGVNLDTGGLTFSFGMKPSSTTSSWGDAFKPKEGSWSCQTCYVQNDANKQYCISCDAPKDDTEPKKTNKALDLTGPTQFTFGIPTTNTTTAKTENPFDFKAAASKDETSFTLKPEQETDQFVFGSPQKRDFEFTPRSPGRRISTGQKDDESDNSYVEEECDNIYFKPVIPLPDKVDVKTGEEEEDVLYCHRAKLFRFTNGEWKERGIGDIKILKGKNNGKLRVVMRREQVHKICLNHALTPDIEYHTKDDKTWLFYAHDFSDGEISHDRFCLRFKNAEIAKDFERAVKEALSDADSSKAEENEDDEEVVFVSETQVIPEEEKEARALMLPPKFMSYRRLPDCTCEQCKKDDEYLKDLFKKPSVASVASTPGTASSGFTFGTPVISSSSPGTDSLKDLLSRPSLLSEIKSDTSSVFMSANNTQNKSVFGSPLPESVKPPSTTSTSSPFNLFASTAATTPKTTTNFFGTAATSTPGSGAANKSATTGSIFSVPVSSSTTGTSIFGAPANVSTPTTSIFGAPANVSSTTTSLFGNAATTKHVFGSTASSPQLTESAKTTSGLTPSTTTQPSSIFSKSFLNTASTTPTTTPPAKLFNTSTLDAQNKSKINWSNTSDAMKNFSFTGTAATTGTTSSSSGTIENPFCTNTQPLFGSTATPKASKENLFAGSTNSPATTSAWTFDNKPTITQTSTTTSTASSLFATNAASPANSSPLFGTPDTSTTSLFSTASTGAPTTLFGTPTKTLFGSSAPMSSNTSLFSGTPGTASSTSLFGGTTSIFGGTTANKTATTSAQSIFGGTSDKLLTATPVFGAGTQLTTKDLGKVDLKEDDKPILDSTGSTFATLAANVSTEAPPAFAAKKHDTFAFLGAGAPVFGSVKKGQELKKSDESGGGDAGEDKAAGDEEYEAHYEPIVPLPDAVVVSTGEEDEKVLFNERAKLFRYHSDTKEWKERGVGQMKILYHPVNNTYRFLLRREQIHKVVLNQLLLPDLDLQPMVTSDKAWIWAGYNYTDDGQSLEKLAIRFKNEELALKFRNVVEECIAKLKENVNKLIPASIQNYGTEDVSSEELNVQQDDEDDEDEEDDEDDRSVMFMKRCTLFELVGDNKWQQIAMGDIQVYYDPELYAARISMNDNNGLVVSNTLIGINTVMEIEKNSCMWKAVECCVHPPRWRTFKATFSSEAAAQEYHTTYLEGLNYAQQVDIVDIVPNNENDYYEEEEETES